MLPTRRFQEENDCGINYFWTRLSQVSPLDWTGWMVISQKIHVFCIQLWETPPTIFQNSSKRGMLVQDLIPFTLSFWPLFFGHCLLSLFLLSCQVSIASGRATCPFTHGGRSHNCIWERILGSRADKGDQKLTYFTVWGYHRAHLHLGKREKKTSSHTCIVSFHCMKNAAVHNGRRRQGAVLLWEHEAVFMKTFPPGSLQQAYVSDEYFNLCPMLLPTDSC